jgi:hypothetical protein
MKEQTKRHTTVKDTQGFPAPTAWTRIHSLKNRPLHEVQAFVAELYLEPLRRYAFGIAAELCLDVDRKQVEDWVMEFIEFKLAAVITAQSTRRPADAKPLFRHLVRRRFMQFVNDQRDHAATQKRGGHLRRAELVSEGLEDDQLVLEPTDNQNNTPDVAYDLALLRQYYLQARDKVRQEFSEKRKTAEFEVLIEAVEDGDGFRATETAKKLPGKSEGAIRTAKSRLETRLRELLVECVARAEQIGIKESRQELKALFEINPSEKGPVPTVLAPI